MSRSTRKGYCNLYSGDKYFRNYYTRSLRRKTRNLLRKQMLTSEDECPVEKLPTKGVDYGCRFADPWSWPSDGRTYFDNDISSLRQQFDEEIFGNDPYGDDPWEEYVRYRDAKLNAIPCKWQLSYNPYKGEELKTSVDWFFVPETESYKSVVTTTPVAVYGEKVSVILDHHPYVSDVPKDATNVYFYKIRNRGNQPHNDWGVISFCFHRNVIPTNFTDKDQLIGWLRKNEEKILRSWFNVLYRK